MGSLRTTPTRLARALAVVLAAGTLVGSLTAVPAAADVPLQCTDDQRTAADRLPRPMIRTSDGLGPMVAVHTTTGFPDVHVFPTFDDAAIRAEQDFGLVSGWENGTDCTGNTYSRNAWLTTPRGDVITVNGNSGPLARFYGDASGTRLNRPVVGLAATPTGRGYWLVASDGGIFTYGDARFYGSTGALRLTQPIVGMTATATGRGYWMVARDGGIFTFGDARFRGSLGGRSLPAPIAGMVARDNGYILVDRESRAYDFR